MNLYQYKNTNNLSILQEKTFKLEKEIQILFEKKPF